MTLRVANTTLKVAESGNNETVLKEDDEESEVWRCGEGGRKDYRAARQVAANKLSSYFRHVSSRSMWCVGVLCVVDVF